MDSYGFGTRTLRTVFLMLLIALVSGCGTMKVEEVYYLAVPDETNTNYFRIRIKADTQMTDAKYEAHWVSADAVDALYSDQNDTDRASAINTEKRIREVLNKKLEAVLKKYLAVAQNPNSTDAEIQKWMKAYKRLRAMPGPGTPLPKGAVEMEYNPISNLITTRAGQKMILTLSSDPEKVISAISNFASSQATSASVLRLADIAGQQRLASQAEQGAELNAEQVLFTLLSEHLKTIENATEEPDKTGLQTEIDSLIHMTEAMQ